MSEESGTHERTEGLSVERVARNDAIFREANERISASAEAFDIEDRIPFVCECADPACRDLLLLKLDEYRQVRSDPRHFLNAPGHHVAAQGWVEVIARRDGYVMVAKVGRAGEVVEQLEGEPDPASAPIDDPDEATR